MDKIKELILKKPTLFIFISFAYLFGVGLMKWWIHPTMSALWFLVGGGIGIYFLDGAELFFQLTPSPFRSTVFFSLFAVVSFFVVTSSGSALASGLVLSLYLQMILRLVGEWLIAKNQQVVLLVLFLVFVLETYFFIH